MPLIKILPKTPHLRNRVKERGDIWEVVEFSQNGDCLCRSTSWTFKDGTKDLRWVNKEEFQQLN